MARFLRKLAVTAVIFGVGFISIATAQGPKDLVEQAPFVPGEVLVRFKPGVAVTAQMQAHAGISPGIRVLERFDGIVLGLQRVQLPSNLEVFAAIRLYQRNPDVLYAEPNYIWQKAQQVLVTPGDPSFDQLWGLHNIGQTFGIPDADIDAPEAWDIVTDSSSVVIAVIDTGVDYNHFDLTDNMWRNTLDCNANGVDDDGNGFIDDCYGIDTFSNDTNPMDEHDHGTHVAGTIGARGNNGIGVVGVNWRIQMMACRFLGPTGGSTTGAINCLNYVGLMKDRGVNVIATNNSWGGGGFSQSLLDAIQAHMSKGILFIAAAGNSNQDNDATPFYPASYYMPNVISVAATDHNDVLADFGGGSGSHYGRRTVHVGAPGKNILSTVRNNNYASFQGTSMAAPHVTGLAALLKAHNPSRDWIAIRNLIFATGDIKASLQNRIVTDRRVNAHQALTCSNTPFFGVLRPLTRISSGGPTTVSVININCATPAGALTVTINPGGTVINLEDNGTGPDLAANDGIYSGTWNVPAPPSGLCNFGTTYTLNFSNGASTTALVGKPKGSYGCTTPALSWRTITGTNLNILDEGQQIITTPFPVQFGTNSYGSMRISDNGLISFTNDITGTWSNQQLPNAARITLIAPFWDDLYPSGSSNVYWAVLGSAPSRELVIEWRDMRHWVCSADAAATVRFQVVFFENSNQILFNYLDTVFGGSCSFGDFGGSATIGVQASSSDASQNSFNTQMLTDNSAVHWSTAPPSCTNTDAIFRVERATGNACADGSWNAGGADVAEFISTTEVLQPGDLVEIDPQNPKHYRRTQKPYSTLVAGVISTRPGLILGLKLSAGADPHPAFGHPLPSRERDRVELNLSLTRLDEGTMLLSGVSISKLAAQMQSERPLLALLGRVPVKATTENGPIRPGDLLISSSKPGYAMRCESAQKCEGTIVGKALEALDAGEGVILLLLMR